jgi:hypothetical protein
MVPSSLLLELLHLLCRASHKASCVFLSIFRCLPTHIHPIDGLCTWSTGTFPISRGQLRHDWNVSSDIMTLQLQQTMLHKPLAPCEPSYLEEGCLHSDWQGLQRSVSPLVEAGNRASVAVGAALETAAAPSPPARATKFKFKIRLNGQIVAERGVLPISPNVLWS